MKKLSLSMGLVLALALAWAVQSRITFQDKDSNMVLRDFDSWHINFLRKGLEFRGSGNPLVATWELQGMTITAQRIEGTAARIKEQQGYSLQSATVSGNVRATLQRESAQGTQTTRLESASMRFNSGAQANRIEVPGAFTMVNSTRATGGTVTLNGASGVVMTPSAGDKPFISAEIAGPVTFETTESEQLEWRINGRADKVEIDNTGANPVATLIGNVVIKGNHPVLYADLTGVQRAVLNLNSQYSIQSVEITGSPARVTGRDLPKGGS